MPKARYANGSAGDRTPAHFPGVESIPSGSIGIVLTFKVPQKRQQTIFWTQAGWLSQRTA